MTILWGDTETRSRCDLKTRGAYNYAADASTQILCFSYAFDDEPVQSWVPGTTFPQRVIDHIYAGGQLRFHNAGFDRLILWYVLCPDMGVPEPRLEQFCCTAAQARANCLPGSLEDVGRAVSSKMKKDHRGAQLIRLLSIPRADGTFNNDPGLMAEFINYCEQDVRAMREISKSMRPLSDTELDDYHVNERINDRGVLVDLDLCHAAVQYAEAELQEIQAIVAEVTKGAVTSVRSPRMRQWVQDRVGPEALKLMWTGEKYSIDKSVRANLLTLGPDQVPADVNEVIQCADDLWASSVAKFKRLADLADVDDDRVRGAFVFAGGSATGRASSYGAQVHNFTRKTAKEPFDVRQAMVRGHDIVPAYGPRVTDVLKGMLRPALIPAPGNVLVVADWSAIEGRVNPWLSNCPAGEAKLDVFRSGLDPYKVNAVTTFSVAYADVTGDQRQCGKVQELALGFLGGEGSFDTFSRIYGIGVKNVPRAIRLWRTANPWAMKHGQDLEAAYTRAMRHRGHEIAAGRVVYMYDGQHLWYALPSGRVLCYPFAKLEQDGVSYLKAAWKPAADATEWPRARLWRGLAVENCWAGNTRLYTASGLKYIKDILPSDLLWDGVSWVPHGGVVCNGEQEVIEWAGTQVTPHHRITDGQQWRNVIDLDDRTTSGCLAWGRASVPWSCSLATASGRPYDATAGYQTAWKPVRYAEGVTAAPRVANGPQQKRKKSASLKTMLFGNYGYTEEAVQSPGVMTRNIKPILTMVGEAYRSMRRGLRTNWSGCATPLRSPVGTIQNWISTALTTMGITRPAIYVWPPAVKTPTIDGAHVFSALKDLMSPSLSSGVSIAPAGVATTPSRTTSNKAAPATRSPHTTKQLVYDIRNCGPNHRYAVETELGPVIAHNCTQAVANDLLRHALRRLSNVVLHVHDEVVVESAEEDGAAEVERVMCEAPAWAAGLPLAVEVKIMMRYGK